MMGEEVLKNPILTEGSWAHKVDWERDLLVAPWIKFPVSATWEPVLDQGEAKSLRAGQLLARPGDPADGIYLLRRGEIKIVARTQGGLFRTFCTMGEESVIGEISLFSDKPYLQYIQAVSDCLLIFFSRQTIDEVIIAKHPGITAWLFRNLAAKADVTSSMIEETTFYNINIRVARLIYLYSQEYGQPLEGGRVSISISQMELAERLGAHRVTVTKAINQLKKEGVIVTRPSRIIIPDPAALREKLFQTL